MSKRGWAILGVSVALVAVCGLATYTLYATVSVVRSANGAFHWFDRSRTRMTQRESATYRVGQEPHVTVDTTSGGITVTVGADGVIEVETVKTAWAVTQPQTAAMIAALPVTAVQTGDDLALRYRPRDGDMVAHWGPGGGWPDASVSYNIKVPRAVAVTLTTANGPVSLTGTRGRAELSSNFGDVTASDISGGQSLTLESGGGAITVQNSQPDTVSVQTGFGDVTLDEVAAHDIAAHSDNGRLSITGATVTPVAGAAGRLMARSRFGDIVVRRARSPQIDVETANGAVEVADSTGPLRLHSNFGDITVTDAHDAVLDLATDNGDVSFQGTLAEVLVAAAVKHSVTSQFGDVAATIPPDSRLDVLLKSDFGSVSTDLPVTVVGESAGNQLAGKLNGGGRRLELTTTNGRVKLTRAGS